MSTPAPVDTESVTETQWERLRRLIDLRRDRLDLTLAGIHAVGGPSPKWVHKLPYQSGPPSERMRASLSDLDRALRWDVGTSWGLVDHDRSAWNEAVLQDEEASLVDLGPDEADDFAFVIAARIRALPAEERDDAMRRVLAALGVEC